MNENNTTQRSDVDIPEKIFRQFIDELSKDDMSVSIVDNLERVLLLDNNVSEANLRSAMTLTEKNDKAKES